MTRDEAIAAVERHHAKAKKLYALAREGNGTTESERLAAALAACRELDKAYTLVAAVANREIR